MSVRLRLFGSLACLAVAAAPARAQINGSFELPVQSPGGFTDYFVGSPFLTGWSVVGAPGAVAVVSGAFTCCGSTFAAQDGNQWLDLTGGTSTTATGVEQTIGTTMGNQYTLSYWVGNVNNGSLGTISTVNTFIDAVAQTPSVNSVSSLNLYWVQFTHVFTASAALTTLRFINGDGPGDNNNGLDNIVLTDNGPAVTGAPEPGTVALLATGLLGLIPVARRRRSAR